VTSDLIYYGEMVGYASWWELTIFVPLLLLFLWLSLRRL
jgi:hypothetical protein